MFVYADTLNRDGATKRRFIVVPGKNVPLLQKSVKPMGKKYLDEGNTKVLTTTDRRVETLTTQQIQTVST